MPTVRRIVIAPYSASSMYKLVEDIDSYPSFLPWCQSAQCDKNQSIQTGKLSISYKGLKTTLVTQNTYMPPKSITMQLQEGPLSQLNGHWQFIPIEDHRCRVELELSYAFNNIIMEKLFSPLFSYVFERFVNHFMERAKATYGTSGKGYIAIEIINVTALNLEIEPLIVAENSTVGAAFQLSQHTASTASLSIYGTPCTLQTVLKDGDRIEINTALLIQPREQRRQRANQ